jgi:molecular chaperone HscB
MNPFETLGIEPRFALDLSLVEKRYRDLAKVVHPDRHVAGSRLERQRALSKAVDINQAWQTVRDPIRRAEALLHLRGVALGEENARKASPELLMDIMELREELADAKATKDTARMDELRDRVQVRERKLLDTLGELFDQQPSDNADNNVEVLETCQRNLNEMRYVRRFLEEVRAIEDELLN